MTVIDEPAVPLPAASVPPLLMAALPTAPSPVSVPPLLTVTPLDAAMKPSTRNVPPPTVVAPV